MGSESEGKKKQKSAKKNKKNSGGNGTAKDVGGGGGGGGGGKHITDDRFASAQSDPRFMEAPKKRSKVEIDSRFTRVFTDRWFTSSNARIDKRGKPKKNDDKSAASLSHYYRLQQPEEEKKASPIKEEEEEEEDSDAVSESHQIGDETESESESEKLNEKIEESDDDEDQQSVDESSSTSTGSDSDSDVESVDEEDDDFLQPESNIPIIDKETNRLAVVNLDWSQVRAVDLYVLMSSCVPKGGQIVSVTVYPSEFGLKRMEEEAVRGPVGLFDDDEEESDGEDDEIDNTKLRAYELSRLRYYYAVVECDSVATADYIYKTCDGIEFERSANKLDLRFIPDSMEFKHQPRDTATEAPADYEGIDFQTRALQHSNIHLTWDEDEPQRVKTMKRKLNDGQLAELEMKEFLASDDSESDEEDNVDNTEEKSLKKCSKRDKYRALVQSGDGSDEDNEDDSDQQDMEVTFNTDLEDISKRILEKKNKEAETVWESYLRKRKEKKKASKKGSKYSSSDDEGIDHTEREQVDDFFVEDEPSVIGSTRKRKAGQETAEEAEEAEEASRAELELLTADDNGEANLKGYNLKPKKIKGKKGKGVQDEAKIPTFEVEDPRFSAILTSSHFSIDPTDPQYKRSATYVRQVAQKQKIGDKKNSEQTDHFEIPDEPSMHKHDKVISEESTKRKEKNELSSLVKSIKMKSSKLSLASQAKVPQKRTNLQFNAKRQKK
ncbi:hypothetical protein ABFX02_06G178100 [Erythranthe guttata]